MPPLLSKQFCWHRTVHLLMFTDPPLLDESLSYASLTVIGPGSPGTQQIAPAYQKQRFAFLLESEHNVRNDN